MAAMRTWRAVGLPAILAGALALARPAMAAPAELHPDLTGVWTNASVTHLQRPPGIGKLVLSPAEGQRIEKSDFLVSRLEADAKPSDATAGAPPPGDPQGYNTFWLDPGTKLGRVKGEIRSSWIVDPPDGRLPLTEAGRRKIAQAQAFSRDADTPAGPESLEPWDRCIIGSRGSGGPGMLNNIYNSNYQIVQTPQSVTIVVEMVHDARTIPVFPDKAAAQAGHGPAGLHPWLGDSTAWWDGPTLVIETLHVNAEQGRAGPIFLTPEGRVTERLTRTGKDAIFYAFEVEDPAYYTRPWRAEMTLSSGPGQIYEYACHEGNYALVGILQATRKEEAQARTSGAKPAGR
jgi:hypothetical protein